MFKQSLRRLKMVKNNIFWCFSIHHYGAHLLGGTSGVISSRLVLVCFFYISFFFFSLLILMLDLSKFHNPSIYFSFGFGLCPFNWYFLFELSYRIKIYFHFYFPLIFKFVRFFLHSFNCYLFYLRSF